MPIDPDSLSSLAGEYTKRMTSIRGRRVQRLLKREFAGAEHVLLAEGSTGTSIVLGLSLHGAAICATDGKGKQATVVKWSHESTAAIETHFDLYKDSLPILGSGPLSFTQLREQIHLHVPSERIPSRVGTLVAKVLRVLA